MLFWVIQITVISIIFIFLIHHLINFFKSTLTVPKIKDLVNTSSQKYEEMMHIISNKNYRENVEVREDYSILDLLPKSDDSSSMKDELKNFFKKQLDQSSSTEISALDSMNTSYSMV